jgi:hypothetical protein
MKAIRFEEENLPLIAEYFDTADMMRIKRRFDQKARNRHDFFIIERMECIFGCLQVEYFYASTKQLTQKCDFEVLMYDTKWFDITYKKG